MSGHMGDERSTTQNLEIVEVDSERGLILVKGAVPGSKGGYVLVSDAVKRARPDEAPFPAGLLGDSATTEEVETEVEAAETAEAVEATETEAVPEGAPEGDSEAEAPAPDSTKEKE